MPLPPLQWRKLPPRTIETGSVDTSYFLNIIYDMLTGSVYYDGSARIIGSGSAWRNTTKFVTGSNTEAVYTFPATNTEMSQSIIFAAKNYFGSASVGTPPVVTDTSPTFDFTTAGRDIGIACVKLAASQSFTQWTSLYPFGSSSFSTGYSIFTKGVYMYTGNRITIYEGTEAMAIVVSFQTSSCNVAVAGAIIDPEQTTTSIDAELDNRIYGVATSGVTTSTINPGLNPRFMYNAGSSTGDLFYHRTGANTSTSNFSRFVALTPQAQNTFPVGTEKSNYAGRRSFPQGGSISDRVIQLPIKCVNANSQQFVGKLRDINQTQFFYLNQVIIDKSSNIVGFSISANEYLTSIYANAVCLSYN